MTIRVLIADDHDRIRAELTTLVRAAPAVVVAYESGTDAIRSPQDQRTVTF